MWRLAPILLSIPALASAYTASAGGRRVDIDGVLEVREVLEVDRDTSRDRTQESLRLRVAAPLADWLRFDATAIGLNGGPTFHSTRSGVFNLRDVFQDVNPSIEVEEAYAHLSLGPVDIRLGKQKHHWGKLDRVQPNDLLNPYRYHDPFLLDQDERKIGVPGVAVDYAGSQTAGPLADPRLTLVWQPLYAPFRYPEAGERWFPPAAVPPSVFYIPPGLVGAPASAAVPIPVTFATRNVDPPARRLENSTVGLRASAVAAGFDLAAYYYHGFDVQPAFQLLAEVSGEPQAGHPLGAEIAAHTFLEPAFSRIDAWGADAAYTIDPVVVRLEGAFIRNRPFARDLRRLVADPTELDDEIQDALAAIRSGQSPAAVDLGRSYAVRDALEWGLGADYVLDGWMALFQVNQTDVFDNRTPLLVSDVETRLLANIRKAFLGDTLRAQLIAVHAIERDYSLVLPRLSYALSDHLEVRLGYLAIAGRASSTIGQFKRNDQGFVRLRFAF